MSKYFKVRHPIPVTIGDQTHTFYARELGYMEFRDLNAKAVSGVEDKEARGRALMAAVVLACVEEEDGTPSYATPEEWRDELKEAFLAISSGAMGAQGFDLQKLIKEEKELEQPPDTEDEIQGNVEPSRTSGENSPSSSAAEPLVN